MKAVSAFLNRHLSDFCFLIFAVATTIGAFTGGLWASLGIGFAFIAFFGVWLIEGRIPQPDKQLFGMAVLMLAVCAVLNIFSWQPRLSWMKWEQLATIFLPLSFLSAPAIQKRALSPPLFALLPVLAMISALALGVELALHIPLLKLIEGSAAQIFHYNRGFSYLVILAFPLMAILTVSKRRWMIVPFIAILFFPAALTDSRAAKLALVLGLLTVFAAHFFPVLVRWALAFILFVSTDWAFAAQKLFLVHHDWVDRLPHSWKDRVDIWDNMSYRILEHPLFGWGLGTSPKLPYDYPHGALYLNESGAPHPHNALIQLWVETGLPGLAIGVAFAFLLLHRAGRLRSEFVPYALGAWMAAFCISMIAYDFWTDSLWATFALTGFTFALLQRPVVRN